MDLDESEPQWRFGSDLPDSFCCAGSLQDLDGGIILAGGYSKDEKYLVTISFNISFRKNYTMRNKHIEYVLVLKNELKPKLVAHPAEKV